MGCSSSNVEEKKEESKLNKDVVFSEKFLKEKEKINIFQSKIDVISQKNPDEFKEKFDAFKIAVRENNEEHINTFLDNYKEHFEKEKFDKNAIIEMALEYHAQDILPSEFEIKEWDVHEFIIEIVNEICEEINEEKMKNFVNFLKLSEEMFPKVQNGILYDIPSEKDSLINLMNKQLKVNDKFNKMKILNIQFQSDNENDNIYEDIAEIIKYNLNLCTLVIFLKFTDFEKNQENFEKFTLILDSIQSNKALKVFVLNFEENTGFTFPIKFYQGLFKMINYSSIVGMFINSCTFDENNLNTLFSILSQNNRLKFLGINFIDSVLPCFENMIKALEGHKSLYSVFISGGSLKEEHVDLLYEKTKAIKIVEYRKSI
jgi:hypothetical protein